jgi:hypothetical protein
MDKLREFHSEREKRMYNLMSYELFDLLDPKREMKIMNEDLRYFQELEDLPTDYMEIEKEKDKTK